MTHLMFLQHVDVLVHGLCEDLDVVGLLQDLHRFILFLHHDVALRDVELELYLRKGLAVDQLLLVLIRASRASLPPVQRRRRLELVLPSVIRVI